MKLLIVVLLALGLCNSASALTDTPPYCSAKTQRWCFKSCLKYKTAKRLRKCAIRCIKLNGCYKISLIGR